MKQTNPNEKRSKIAELEDAIADLKGQLERQQHTPSTIACLEDALAIALDIIQSNEIQQEFINSRLNQLITALRRGRISPRAYPVDLPAGKRPDTFIEAKKELEYDRT